MIEKHILFSIKWIHAIYLFKRYDVTLMCQIGINLIFRDFVLFWRYVQHFTYKHSFPVDILWERERSCTLLWNIISVTSGFSCEKSVIQTFCILDVFEEADLAFFYICDLNH